MKYELADLLLFAHEYAYVGPIRGPGHKWKLLRIERIEDEEEGRLRLILEKVNGVHPHVILAPEVVEINEQGECTTLNQVSGRKETMFIRFRMGDKLQFPADDVFLRARMKTPSIIDELRNRPLSK